MSNVIKAHNLLNINEPTPYLILYRVIIPSFHQSLFYVSSQELSTFRSGFIVPFFAQLQTFFFKSCGKEAACLIDSSHGDSSVSINTFEFNIELESLWDDNTVYVPFKT